MKQQAPLELGTEKVSKLLFQYALPAIVAMTAASVLNIVDRIFIGQGVGPLAISGLATTLPFMNLSAAFGALVGVGSASVISIRLGQGNYETAKRVLGNSVTLNVGLSLLFTIVSWFFMDKFLFWFGASNNTLRYARSYMEVLLICNIITHCYFGFNHVLRATGHPTQAMMCTILAVGLNCVLDPLFIYVFHWGIRGAAIATVLAQTVSLIWQLMLLNNPREVLHLQRGIYKVSLTIIGQILAIGMSPFLMNCCACLVVLFINAGMRKHGDLLPIENGGDMAIAAYGIVNSVIFFFLMIVMGINQGMQPIAGYNWGARLNQRVWQVLRYSIYAATLITLIGFLIGEFTPDLIIRMFTHDSTIIEIATRGFRIDVLVFPIVGAQMVIGNFFQNIGHAGKSIFLSVTRQALFLIPGLYLLPLFWGLDGVWAAIPISDAISFVFAFAMLLWLIKRVNKNEAHRLAQ